MKALVAQTASGWLTVGADTGFGPLIELVPVAVVVPGLAPASEGLDDDHVPTTAWTRRIGIERLFRHIVIGWWSDGE
jgi:hypothetical protein